MKLFNNYICSSMEISDKERYFLHLAYDGTHFHGWQFQLNAVSVQETIKAGLEKILNTSINIVGCGRTDTGVHASQYFAHFDIDKSLPDRFLMKINAVLPSSIAIYDCYKVDINAHARYDAYERSYVYKIHTRKNPFLRTHSFEFIHYDLNWDLIFQATELLKKYDSFKPLIKVDKLRPVYTSIIKEVYWVKTEDHQYHFHITANRFLYNMIRRIVGTMILIGRGQLSIDEFTSVMDQQSEFRLIKLAPSNGLTLSNIKYPFDLISICQKS